MLGEGPTFGINGSFGSSKKKFNIDFSKANKKFCLNFHYNTDHSYLFVNGEKKGLKPTIKILTFQHNFVSEAYLMEIVLLSLGNYLQMEMCMIFESITINLTY